MWTATQKRAYFLVYNSTYYKKRTPFKIKEAYEKMKQEREEVQKHRQTIFTGGYDKERNDEHLTLCWGYTEGEVL